MSATKRTFFCKTRGSVIFLGNFDLCCVHLFWTNLIAFNLLFGPAMNKLKVSLSMAIQIEKKNNKKTFLMWSKVRTDSTNFLKYKITISQNGAIFSLLSVLKMLSFFLVAETLTGLTYHRPVGENFGSVQTVVLSEDRENVKLLVAICIFFFCVKPYYKYKNNKTEIFTRIHIFLC